MIYHIAHRCSHLMYHFLWAKKFTWIWNRVVVFGEFRGGIFAGLEWASRSSLIKTLTPNINMPCLPKHGQVLLQKNERSQCRLKLIIGHKGRICPSMLINNTCQMLFSCFVVIYFFVKTLLQKGLLIYEAHMHRHVHA